MSTLKGRVALVTGAARGIGRAIALELACRGAAVALNYRTSRAASEELLERIKGLGVPGMLAPGDVSLPANARSIVAQVIASWGRLDILVNNAGITRDQSMRKLSGDEWSDVVNVNPNGTFYCTNAAIPTMVEQKFGRIINIHVSIGQGNHAAGNGGILAFTKTVALEMAPHNITVNAVSPGFTFTEMLSQVPPNIQDQIKAKIPMRRFGGPEEVAKAVAFLAADGDYITGQHLGVNGGISM